MFLTVWRLENLTSKCWHGIESPGHGAGKTSQWLKAPSVLLKDLGSVPSKSSDNSRLSMTPTPGAVTTSGAKTDMQAKYQST